MLSLRRTVLALILPACATSALAAPPSLIELQVGKEKYQGKVFAHDDKSFWLLGQDGQLRQLATERVKEFRQLSPQFSGWNATIVRDQLVRELGRGFDVAATRHYLVCAHGDQKARKYAETFEELFRTFQSYFSVRNFKVVEPDFPLVAIVFPDAESFGNYARKDKVPANAGLRGYYLMTSNRVALFEQSGENVALELQTDLPDAMTLVARNAGVPPRAPWRTIEASLKDTMIHEATHQVAFNTGLHSRLGANPQWVVEGLATVFEAAGIRNSSANSGIKSRVNPERLICFGNFAKSRRKPQSLEEFVSSDDAFKENILDAYSQAWALSFFLVETRPRNYADYLKLIAARNPLREYSRSERLADFQKSFSKELKLLDAEFLRFIAGIR